MPASSQRPGEMTFEFLLKQCLRHHGGLIIIGKRESDKDWFYLDEYDCFRSFDDETTMQSPKVYRTLSGVMKKAVKIDELFKDFQIDIKLWVHPDIHHTALGKYKSMTGIRYTGSVRQ